MLLDWVHFAFEVDVLSQKKIRRTTAGERRSFLFVVLLERMLIVVEVLGIVGIESHQTRSRLWLSSDNLLRDRQHSNGLVTEGCCFYRTCCIFVRVLVMIKFLEVAEFCSSTWDTFLRLDPEVPTEIGEFVVAVMRGMSVEFAVCFSAKSRSCGACSSGGIIVGEVH